jgi:outer membrane receptor protein involved in Fe transport
MAAAPFSTISSTLAPILLTVSFACGQSPELLPPITVLAERQLGESSATPLARWNREDISLAAPRTIDEMLAKEPSFSLYRRQSSISSNPTAAGVSLRNTGATAASRTLVLLDGIPQNDPFGGWVYWARYDAATLDSIRIDSAARAAVWGNQSPAGVIQMNGRPAFETFHVLKAGGGSQGTLSSSTVNQLTNEDKTISALFSAFGLHTDGFFAVDSSQRGPVDRKLDTDLYGANLKFSWLAAPGLTVEPGVSWYAEERGNGTALSENSTDAVDLSLRVSSIHGDISWQAVAWHQQRDFESTFSSVNATRSAETLALDQFDVPADATGGSFTTLWDGGGKWTVSSGADARKTSGETNENVGTFRKREAGGGQSLVGLFTAASYQANEQTKLDASVRLDWWELSDGRRNEASLTSGKTLRAEVQDDRDGLEPSASVEASHQINEDLLGLLSVGTASRLPTLNELHRPFRVRNDIVEANPELDPERFFSISGTLEAAPTDTVTLRGTLFQHWIKDAIANVPVTSPAQIKQIFGTIPPGGSGSQRQNVEQAQVTSLEGSIEWLPVASLNLGLTGLWSRTDFTKSPDQPLLEGNPFPQAPDLRLIASATWQATDRWAFFAGGEYGASQYDDALASRSIPSFTTVRIGSQVQIGRGIYQIRVENLFDEEIQTGLSSDGIRTYAGPRSLWVGAEWEF